ncbi:hypothetical protein Tco_1257038, partial [Tanacetum coccineum]
MVAMTRVMWGGGAAVEVVVMWCKGRGGGGMEMVVRGDVGGCV